MTYENPPTTTKPTTADRQRRHDDKIASIRLRMAISRELDNRGITTRAGIAEALGMPEAEATRLMTGRKWREDGVALLEVVAARLGVVVGEGSSQ